MLIVEMATAVSEPEAADLHVVVQRPRLWEEGWNDRLHCSLTKK